MEHRSCLRSQPLQRFLSRFDGTHQKGRLGRWGPKTCPVLHWCRWPRWMCPCRVESVKEVFPVFASETARERPLRVSIRHTQRHICAGPFKRNVGARRKHHIWLDLKSTAASQPLARPPVYESVEPNRSTWTRFALAGTMCLTRTTLPVNFGAHNTAFDPIASPAHYS